jgi:hypothetical protein
MDLTVISDMPVSTAALVVSQKAIEIKFDQRSPVLVGSCKTQEQRQY